jgi:hypothetical protein
MLSAIMMSAIMMSAIMMSAAMLSAALLSVFMLCDAKQNVIMLSAAKLNVVMLSVVMLNIVAPKSRVHVIKTFFSSMQVVERNKLDRLHLAIFKLARKPSEWCNLRVLADSNLPRKY